MARINFSQLKFEVEKQITKTRAFRQLATQEATARVEAARTNFLEDFESHPITREIEDGPDRAGSKFLNGYGNLFSFIGFTQGEEPIQELYDYLETHVNLVKTPVTLDRQYLFRVNIPSESDLATATPMPWGTAQSWLSAIEHGVPGFNKYLFDLDREFRNSRSGPAIQAKSALRNTTYEPQQYITPLLRRLKDSLRA